MCTSSLLHFWHKLRGSSNPLPIIIFTFVFRDSSTSILISYPFTMKITQAFSASACGYLTIAFAAPAPAEAMDKDLIASGAIVMPELNARTMIGLCKWHPNHKTNQCPNSLERRDRYVAAATSAK